MNHTFEIGKKDFLLDGEPFRVISGAIHYFRVPREYWRDRLIKLKACGFNTVETYIAWNMHEPEEGVFDFEGMLDIEAYLSLAQELGLYAIVRPGPYICSEWDFGGLPWWILNYENTELRCSDETYLACVKRFYDELIPRLAKHQVTNGGNIILVQDENEYGSYGDDSDYLRRLASMLRDGGITVPLFTSDGAEYQMMTGGTLPEIHKTANFGSNPEKNFAFLRKYQPEGPLMCAEYWNGWFDHWGESHHTRDAKDAAETLDKILSMGANVSAYMFHGGTNFGWMNGANYYEVYEPTVSSYDDDAPVNENGALTEKYFLFREVVKKYAPVDDIELPEPIPTQNYGALKFTKGARLLDNLENLSFPADLTAPVNMEKLGQGYGYILYSTQARGPREEQSLHLDDLHDRAYIYADGKYAGMKYINDAKGENEIKLTVPEKGMRLDILVENMGRTNYGRKLADRKGITRGAGFSNNYIYNWKAYCLPLDNTDKIEWTDSTAFDGTATFLYAELNIEDEPRDTFIKTDGFKKGVIIVNGRVLSRYWEIGPQRSAYLPAPFLRKGKNTIILLETEGFKSPESTEAPEILLSDTPDLG
ncbi:MAG: beta-galactosidase [Clostridia bacterium]|nr:beta-galactosidase [Clostridia bacterium]